MHETADLVDLARLERIASRVATSAHVDLYGIGGSATMAEEMQSRLYRIGINSHFWPEVHTGLTSAALQDEHSVAIAISNTGRTEETIQMLECAKSTGALTVAVTKMQQLRRERAKGPLADAAAPPAPQAQALRLRLPDGTDEPLTGEIVLGRAPSVSRASGTALPRLVTIGTGDPDISRSHLRVGLEGGTVVVTDLRSRNGTSVVQPGRAPVKLRAGEPTPVLAGTVIDLGGGWTLQVVEG